MAVTLDSASITYPDNTAYEIARPLTVYYWQRTTQVGNLVIVEKDGNQMSVQSNESGGLNKFVTGGGTVLTNLTDLSDNLWHCVAYVAKTDDLGIAYTDGSDDTNTGQRAVSEPIYGTTPFALGARNLNSFSWPGEMAWSVGWDVNIGATIAGALARGVNPFVVLRDNMGWDYPMYDVIDGRDEGPNQLPSATFTGSPTKFSGNPPVELLENYL